MNSRLSSERTVSITRNAIGVCIVATLVGGLLVSAMGYQLVPGRDDHTETLEAGIDSIPENASLVTQNTVYPHVSTRSNATFLMDDEYFHRYESRYGIVTPQYVLIDTKLDTRPRDWSRPVLRAYSDSFGESYGLYRYQDGVFVFKRGYEGPTRGITREEYAVETRRFHPSRSVLAGIDFGANVTRNASDGTVTWQGPWTLERATLPPGTYAATFRLKVDEPGAPTYPAASLPRAPGAEPVHLSEFDRRVGVSRNNEGMLATETVDRSGTWTNVTVRFRMDRSGVVGFHSDRIGDDATRIRWVEVREVSGS